MAGGGGVVGYNGLAVVAHRSEYIIRFFKSGEPTDRGPQQTIGPACRYNFGVDCGKVFGMFSKLSVDARWISNDDGQWG